MRITILFGGTNKERLVSVATAQALHTALPEADLWFWDADDAVHEASGKALLAHARPFEDPFTPDRSRVARSSRHWTGPRPTAAFWCWGCTVAAPKTASCRRCANSVGSRSPARGRPHRILPSTRS